MSIIPTYNERDIVYYFDFDDKFLAHSYPNTPHGYTEPQILYSFYYEGFLTELPGAKFYTWSVDLPFIIVSGQSTSQVTCQLLPILSKNQEEIKYGSRKISYRDYKFSELNLKIEYVGKAGQWFDVLNLYYSQGPIWKIDGNKNPKINTIETYTLKPDYNQIGNPPKNSTDPNNYKFNLKNGVVVKNHGDIPPRGNPKVDILWTEKGSGYLSFYSSWKNEKLKFSNTLAMCQNKNKL